MAERPLSLILAAVLLTGSAGLAPWTNYLAAADNPASASLPSGILFRKRVEEVDVTFAVRDRRGRAMPALRPVDVLVFADGTAVPSFTSFHAGDDVPLQVTLMLDTSDSMGKGFSGERAAATSFLENIIRPEKDRASVVSFATDLHASVAQAQPMLLLTTVQQFRAAGQTALYDALYAMTRASTSGQGEEDRRAIVLLSDGEDNWSRHNLQDVIESAQRADIAIYAITAHSRKLEYPGDRVLERLTEDTGGCAFVLENFSQTDQAFAKIAAELRSQYRLTFRAPAAPIGYHSLRISLRRPGKFQVRSRAGYFSDSE